MAQTTFAMSINYNSGGQFATNVLHYTLDMSGYTTTAAAASGLLLGWDAANRTALKNILSVHTTLLSARARAINVAGGFEATLNFAAGQVGARAGNLMAAGIGACAIFIPTGNKKQRGRMFLPGVSDTDCVDGIFTSSYKTVTTTNLATLITPFNAVNGGAPLVTPVVYSRRLIQAFSIQYAKISPMVAQVRRRQLPA